jgi:transcriptional regulator with XRE-family HTH domain
VLYDKIKYECSKRGMSIRLLEEKSGLSNGVISKWNSASPTLENAKKVADCLEMTVDELLSGTGKE